MHTGATRFLLTAVAIVGLATSGCGRGSHDRAGGAIAPATTVLTLAGHDNADDVRDWADAVDRLSHGSLRIEVESGWRRTDRNFARTTIGDVRDGRVSLASIPARAYDTIGVTSFQGLLAPFLVDSYALQRHVLGSDLPTHALSGVRRLGVLGVALVPGPLQKLLSVGTPLLAPSDYRGQLIGVHRSALEAATFQAIGTTSSELAPGDEDPRLKGIEKGLAELVADRDTGLTPDETLPANVSFWPRLGSIVMNVRAFAALTDDQRAALRGAGRVSLAAATARLERDERAAAVAICRPAVGGPGELAFLSATPSDLSALRAAVGPVYRRLERVGGTRDVIVAVQTMKEHLGAPLAPGCTTGPLRRRVRRAAVRTHVTSVLDRLDRRTWEGSAIARQLGRGRLTLRVRFGFRLDRRFARRATRFRARFPRGTLSGCLLMAVSPAAGGTLAWIGGPGVVGQTSPALREYAHRSLRFAGVTRAGDRGRVRGRFVTDIPTGLPC